jgi:hypothetical protein
MIADQVSGSRSGPLLRLYGRSNVSDLLIRLLIFLLGRRACLDVPRPIGLDNFPVGVGCPALTTRTGAVAQLGERLICIQEVAGSIPTSSTILRAALA